MPPYFWPLQSAKLPKSPLSRPQRTHYYLPATILGKAGVRKVIFRTLAFLSNPCFVGQIAYIGTHYLNRTKPLMRGVSLRLRPHNAGFLHGQPCVPRVYYFWLKLLEYSFTAKKYTVVVRIVASSRPNDRVACRWRYMLLGIYVRKSYL